MIISIISDTHSPYCIEKSLSHLKKLSKTHKDIDKILINGDLLGIFSMDKSTLHKRKKITEKEKLDYLSTAAPRFYNRFVSFNKITKDMVIPYVKERYDWAYDTLKRFSQLKFTIFNMGNHESPLHFLVLRELPFLTGCKEDLIEGIDQKELQKIFEHFEKSLYELEKTGTFTYIRDNIHIDQNTMFLGIPGESHSTDQSDYYSKKQEQKTQILIKKASEKLSEIDTIIIANHTQGKFDNNTGKFETGSISLKRFMDSLPKNIKNKIYIQSHNHWSHTSFQKHGDFHYVLNNAGLHNGIFNLLSFNSLNIDCFDLDPDTENIIKLMLSTDFNKTDKEQMINRYYKKPELISHRISTEKKEEQDLPPVYKRHAPKETEENTVPDVSMIKKKLFL